VEENDIYAYVMLSAQRALLGAITPKIMLISVEWSNLENFKLRVHYDSQPSAEDIEDMEVVSTEIIADVPFKHADPVEIIVPGEPSREVQALKHLVYCRKEKVTDP
jgi:hypothetical protein